MSHEAGHDTYGNTLLGFWLYLLTDAIMFAVLFAAYGVLKGATFGGPSAGELFSTSFALTESILLLSGSYAAHWAVSMGKRGSKGALFLGFGATFVLGILFLGLELQQFGELIAGGNGWQRSAFLSAFFTLIGTHGVHIFFALLWMFPLLIPLAKRPFGKVDERRLTCLRMFWQFLSGVWVFIYTYIYLMGGI